MPILRCANLFKIKVHSTLGNFSFIDISGTYENLKSNKKSLIVCHNFRLSSLYIAVLAFTAALYPYVGSGPDWIYVELVSEGARKYWWTTLLYIQNYYVAKRENHLLNNPSTSISETWYLACDMQMFWISPLFIYPLWRWKKAGLIWTIVNLIAFLGGSVMIFIVNDLPPSVIPSRP